MTRVILKHAWNLYRTNFGVIAAVIFVIFLPMDLLISYMGYFVFDPYITRKSFMFAQFLEKFIGIIAIAGIIFIGHNWCRGQRPSFRGAMSMGLSSWGRMWWTRFLTGLALLFGFLLLIVPGVFLLVRLSLVEPVAVCDRVSGSAAMRRSFELTKGHFWQLFLLGLACGTIMVILRGCVFFLAILISAADYWFVDAATWLAADFISAYGTLCLLSAYEKLSPPLLEGSVIIEE